MITLDITLSSAKHLSLRDRAPVHFTNESVLWVRNDQYYSHY